MHFFYIYDKKPKYFTFLNITQKQNEAAKDCFFYLYLLISNYLLSNSYFIVSSSWSINNLIFLQLSFKISLRFPMINVVLANASFASITAFSLQHSMTVFIDASEPT